MIMVKRRNGRKQLPWYEDEKSPEVIAVLPHVNFSICILPGGVYVEKILDLK